MTTLRIPFLRVPCFPEGSSVRFAHAREDDLTPGQLEVVDAIFEGGVVLDDLARILVEAGEAADMGAARARLEESFSSPDSLIGLVDVEAPERCDFLMIEQGYGGVYVHTIELLKKLRQHWSCFLLSPVSALFEPEPLPEVLSLERLKEKDDRLSYLAWVQICRTLVKKVSCRVLLLAHRSQSLFLFDLLGDRKTVIYCDGFWDGALRSVSDFRLEETPETRRRVLAELYFLLANGNPAFYGIQGNPSLNYRMLMAGGFSLQAAAENWCWGRQQTTAFRETYPHLENRVRCVLPFTDSELFDPDLVDREEVILFTTTMHNIEKKGFPELVRALARLPQARVRCIVRQPHLLPSIPPGVRSRMEIGPTTKGEMIGVYHRAWLNCRTSREESSPLSILEAMSCEVPQIISPTVAEQIPILEDGVTGFVVNPDDKDRLVWALRTLLGDRRLRDRMGRECRRRALTLSFHERIGEFERLLA